jgi:hypothetical protein
MRLGAVVAGLGVCAALCRDLASGMLQRISGCALADSGKDPATSFEVRGGWRGDEFVMILVVYGIVRSTSGC